MKKITKKNVAYEKSYQFAVRIVKSYQFLTKEKKEFVLSKQLLRSGTSIGANLAEANGAISKADFSNKISIAYKECLETKYWFSLLKDTDFIDETTFESVYADAPRTLRIPISLVRCSAVYEAKPNNPKQPTKIARTEK